MDQGGSAYKGPSGRDAIMATLSPTQYFRTITAGLSFHYTGPATGGLTLQTDVPAIADEDRCREPNAATAPDQPTVATMIRQVAIALGIPPEDLARSAIPPCERARFIAETTEALELLARITDPAARQNCLAYLRSVAHCDEVR